MAIQVISPPFAQTIQSDEWFFTFYSETSSLISTPVPGGGVCYSSSFDLGIGATEQECLDYMESQNITDRAEVWLDDLPYNIAGSNGYGNPVDPLNF